jgi:hypothetical protein
VRLSQERLEWLEVEVERRAEAEERLHQLLAGLIWANATRAARVPELEPAREVQYPWRLGRQGGPGPVHRGASGGHSTPVVMV